MNNQDIEKIVEILQSGQLTIFVGAGVSMNSGSIGSIDLIQILSKELDQKNPSQDIQLLSEMYQEKFGRHELSYADMKSICIIPTFVLFEAVKNVLNNKNISREDIEKIIVNNNGIVTKF